MKNHLFELILAIKRKCLATEERIQKQLNLSQAEFHGLLSIKPNEQLPGNTFSERMGLSPSRGSRVLWRLVSKELMRTRTNSEDRRSVVISLTEQGKSVQNNAKESILACEGKIKASLSHEQISRIKESLQLLEQSL